MTTFLHKSLLSFLAFASLFLAGITSQVYAGCAAPATSDNGALYTVVGPTTWTDDICTVDWTVPCGVNSVDVEMWGGGGAGGGDNTDNGQVGVPVELLEATSLQLMQLHQERLLQLLLVPVVKDFQVLLGVTEQQPSLAHTVQQLEEQEEVLMH